MLFQRSIVGNSTAGQQQWNAMLEARAMANAQERIHAAMARQAGVMRVNEGLIPQDVYKAFDNVTLERFRLDDGDVFLNDLLGASRSISIGKLLMQFRRASTAGNAQTSMGGQLGALMDQVVYSYDGAIVPIHDTAFGRSWREWEAMQTEGFDALVDDQREHVATLRVQIVDGFMDGFKDKSGNTIVVDGYSWQGMRNDSRVAAIDLGAGGLNFDFTDTTKTGDEIKNAFIQLRDIMRIDNKCGRDLNIYISNEINSNFERKFSTAYAGPTILEELGRLTGIAAFKATNKLTGNQLMGWPPGMDSVKPLVGMGVNTVAIPRVRYNDDYNFVTWAAVGFEVRTDYYGMTCAFYASV